jgi:branched-chain amino acid transport system ATP-binding protein
VREIARLMLELKQNHQSILLVEQNLAMALQIADWLYVMRKGRIVFEGTPEELIQDEDAKKQYLGI